MLTACGIETPYIAPFFLAFSAARVATVLTACGIETLYLFHSKIERFLVVATVLTACGIETRMEGHSHDRTIRVATVLTACGIETELGSERRETVRSLCCNSAYRLRY